jgi:hypothetical protein
MAKFLSRLALFLVMGALMFIIEGDAAGLGGFYLPSSDVNADGSDRLQETPVAVGMVEPFSLQMSYLQQTKTGQTVSYPGASFIKVHFQTLDLLPGDYVTVSNPDGTEKYTYPGSAFSSDGKPGFWPISITGDTAIIQLYSEQSAEQLSASTFSKSGFIIDKYGRGYSQAIVNEVVGYSLCGGNQLKDAVCYEGTNPTEYVKSGAVARLLVYSPNGLYYQCTGWRAAPGARMFTNNHCIATQASVSATEAWFNYQNQVCGVSSLAPVTKVTGKDLLVTDYTLDFTLFTVNDPSSIAGFGYLEPDPRLPVSGEQIYIPQYGGGNAKQFGIESDQDSGNVCRIGVAVLDGIGVGTDTGYRCDTLVGSSGSPVLASSSNKVIAIHHFGTDAQCLTPNQGVRMDRIWPLVETYFYDLPERAVLILPDGSIGTVYTPAYTWNVVDGATWYQLYVSGPSGNVIDQWYQSADVCSGGICSVTPDVTLAGGAYTWWLRAWNPAGFGEWSAGMDFSAVPLGAATLISPTRSIGASYTPTYTWGEVDGAAWYRLYVSGSSGNVIDQWYEATAICLGGTCSASPEVLLGGGTYTFWVRTWNNAGFGPWSDGMGFSTVPLGAATLVSPTGSIGTNYTPTYTWDEVAGATWYRLYVSGPTGNVIDQWYEAAVVCAGGACSTTPDTTLAGAAHIFWVQTWNPAGFGEWSAGMNFTTMLGTATLVSPMGGIGASYTPTYTWGEVDGAAWYRLYVSGSSGNVIDQWYEATAICLGGTCSASPEVLLGGGTYTFWVRTWNNAGFGPWSDGMGFSTVPLGAATLVSPTGSIGTNYTPTYTWDEVAGATWYRLYVSGPTENVIDQWYEAATICSGGTCSATPDVTLGGGAHTFWVLAWNSAGFGPWSSRMDFTVGP